MSLAREIDVQPDAIDVAVEELTQSLELRSNAGGAIKVKVRHAIELLQPLTAPTQ